MFYDEELLTPLLSTLLAVSEPPAPAAPPPLVLLASSFRSEGLERCFLQQASPHFDIAEVAPGSVVWPALRKEMIRRACDLRGRSDCRVFVLT